MEVNLKKIICLFLFVVNISFALTVLSENVPSTDKSLNENFFYLNLNELFPSQIRYSSQNVEQKINHAVERGAATWNNQLNQWEFKFDNNKSLFELKDAIPVVLAPFGYTLVDGHHQVLASLWLGAVSVPVYVVADLQSLSLEAFWDKAEKAGWAYPYTLDGKKAFPPRDFEHLQDDPNRYFAYLSARRLRDNATLQDSHGNPYPLWLKIGKGIPFIEFKIADALYETGFVYQGKINEDPSEEEIEEARKILSENPIKDLPLIPTRTYYLEIKSSDFHF